MKTLLIIMIAIYTLVLSGCSTVALNLDSSVRKYIALDFLKTAKMYYPPTKTSLYVEDKSDFEHTLIELARRDGYIIDKSGIAVKIYIDKLDNETNSYRATYKFANQSMMSRIYVYCDTNKLCPATWTNIGNERGVK
ncbi:MAG: hypothetical protein KN64_01480 [Sulfurovum sp. AS07-7]|nr:MAG: hypothetical protein KN64_01480 [Sulfurovum sp. AS07-7]